MRKYAVCFIYLLLVIMINAGQDNTVMLDGLIAKVNDHYITIGDVMMEIRPLQRDLIMKYKGEKLRQETRKMFYKALENLISNKLIIDSYHEQKGQIPETAVDERINEILHNVFDDDRAAMMRGLAQENMTYEQWRRKIKDQIIVASMRYSNVQKNINVSAIDAYKYYNKHHEKYSNPGNVELRVIVLKRKDGESHADALKRAKKLREKLVAGADFSELAKKYSVDSCAVDGGDWGCINPDDLRPELKDAIASLDVGGISDVVAIDDTFYICKITGRTPASIKSFAEARDEIMTKLRNMEGERIQKEWIDSLKKKAYVKILDIDPFSDSAK